MPGMLNKRLWLALFAAVATIPQAFAQTLPPSVIACADEADVLKRLSCYDREVARYRTPPATAASRGPSASTAPPSGATTSNSTPARSSAATARPTTPPAVAAPSSSTAADTATATAEFGMNGEIKRKDKTPDPPKLDKLTARIASIAQKPHGESIYSLEDGQVWEEAESEQHIPLHSGEEVTIKRGVLGAFYLSSAEVRGLRVRRVR